MKKKTIFIAAFILAAPIAVGHFYSVNTAQAADPCSLTTDELAAIQAVQTDPSLSASDELTQELSLRRSLLTQVLTCAIGQAQMLQTTLNGTATSDADAKNLQTRLSGKLDDAINYYDIELSEVSTAGITGTEEIAQASFDWRSANYVPLAGQVANFLLWSNNQALFQTAAARLGQVQAVVSFLESAAQNSTIESAMGAVQTSFANAENANDAAEDAMAQFVSPEQSLALIQQSLIDLSDTYTKFLALSALTEPLVSNNQ